MFGDGFVSNFLFKPLPVLCARGTRKRRKIDRCGTRKRGGLKGLCGGPATKRRETIVIFDGRATKKR